MRIIKTMACQMKDELEGAKDYSICALEYQKTKPQLAELYFKMAQMEIAHYNSLHEQVVKIIEEIKNGDKKVPQKMINKWEEEHKKMIECQEEIQAYISLFK